MLTSDACHNSARVWRCNARDSNFKHFVTSVQTRSVSLIDPHAYKVRWPWIHTFGFRAAKWIIFYLGCRLIGTAGSKYDVLGRLSLALKWQNIQREANSSLYKLVNIQFSGEFCTLVLRPYALQRVSYRKERSLWRWRQHAPPKRRYLATWCHNSEDRMQYES